MTKPFQSIRQLFSRVLGNNPAAEDSSAHEYSTLGIGSPEAQPSTNGHGHSNGFAVENSEPDIEVQTADTRRLPQVAPEFLNSLNGNASQPRITPDEGTDEFGDALLDLGDVRGGKRPLESPDDGRLAALAGPHQPFAIDHGEAVVVGGENAHPGDIPRRAVVVLGDQLEPMFLPWTQG